MIDRTIHEYEQMTTGSLQRIKRMADFNRRKKVDKVLEARVNGSSVDHLRDTIKHMRELLERRDRQIKSMSQQIDSY